MADDLPTTGNGNGHDAEAAAAPQVGILVQYVKDLSFENPGAPKSLQMEGQPRIEINVNVGVKRLDEVHFEVELKIGARAVAGESNVAFMVELLYGGLFSIKNLPDDMLEPFLVVEAPRILFPFARRIIADTTRDGGFPPLMLEPIDFGSMYMQQQDAREAAGATGSIVGNA